MHVALNYSTNAMDPKVSIGTVTEINLTTSSCKAVIFRWTPALVGDTSQPALTQKIPY